MFYLNKIFLGGYVRTEPTISVGKNGNRMGMFFMDARSKRRDEKGRSAGYDSCFIRVLVFNRIADNCMKYLYKGCAILVEGMLKHKHWETKDGDRRTDYYIKGQHIQYIGLLLQKGERKIPRREQERYERRERLEKKGSHKWPQKDTIEWE